MPTNLKEFIANEITKADAYIKTLNAISQKYANASNADDEQYTTAVELIKSAFYDAK